MGNDSFRPIQYLGNKSRLLHEIAAAVSDVVSPGERIGDLFAGTSVVGRYLATRNPVTAVDVQAYAETLGKAMLLTTAPDLEPLHGEAMIARAVPTHEMLTEIFAPLIEREREALASLSMGDARPMEHLIEKGSPAALAQGGATSNLPAAVRKMLSAGRAIDLPDATATLTFGGVYFSFEQAIWLDALAHALREEPEPRRGFLMAAVLGACSSVVNTVGKQFAQPMRLIDKQGNSKALLVSRTLRDRALNVDAIFVDLVERWKSTTRRRSHANCVIRAEVDSFLATDHGCAGFYADPPYTIDHYSRFYHVLETIVLREIPELARMRKSGVPTVLTRKIHQGWRAWRNPLNSHRIRLRTQNPTVPGHHARRHTRYASLAGPVTSRRQAHHRPLRRRGPLVGWWPAGAARG